MYKLLSITFFYFLISDAFSQFTFIDPHDTDKNTLIQGFGIGDTRLLSVNDLNLMNLKGSVKSVNIRDFVGVKGISDIEIVASTRDFSGYYGIDYVFNENGYLISKVKLYDEIFDKNEIEKYEYKFSRNNQIIEKNRKVNGELREEWTYTYSSKNLLIEWHHRDIMPSLGRSFFDFVYKYDSQGRLSEKVSRPFVTEYNWATSPIKTIYKFDNNGNLLACIESDNTGKVIKSEKYIYDSGSKDMNVEIEKTDKKIVYLLERYGIHFKFDIQRRLISADYSATLNRKFYYNYDQKGNLIQKTTLFGPKDRVESTEKFFYDKQGNWIYCQYSGFNILNGNNEDIYIIERKIEYYDN